MGGATRTNLIHEISREVVGTNLENSSNGSTLATLDETLPGWWVGADSCRLPCGVASRCVACVVTRVTVSVTSRAASSPPLQNL